MVVLSPRYAVLSSGTTMHKHKLKKKKKKKKNRFPPKYFNPSKVIQAWQEHVGLLERGATSMENQICSHFLLGIRGTVAPCPMSQPAPVSLPSLPLIFLSLRIVQSSLPFLKTFPSPRSIFPQYTFPFLPLTFPLYTAPLSGSCNPPSSSPSIPSPPPFPSLWIIFPSRCTIIFFLLFFLSFPLSLLISFFLILKSSPRGKIFPQPYNWINKEQIGLPLL